MELNKEQRIKEIDEQIRVLSDTNITTHNSSVGGVLGIIYGKNVKNTDIQHRIENLKDEKENIEQVKQEDKKRRRWGGYIIAGLIFAAASSFRETSSGESIVVIMAIGAGFFYYRLKSKIKIKNETAKIIITFAILYVVAGFLIGFLTSLVNL